MAKSLALVSREKTLYIHKDSHYSDSNTRTFWNILSQNFSVSESHKLPKNSHFGAFLKCGEFRKLYSLKYNIIKVYYSDQFEISFGIYTFDYASGFGG